MSIMVTCEYMNLVYIMSTGYVMECTFIINFFYFAAITVGFVETAVNVSESDGMAQLSVDISVPPENISIETSFSLIVNTATGLLAMKCEFWLMYGYIILTVSI